MAPGRRWRLVAVGTALLAGAWLGAAPVRADEVEIPIIAPTNDPATFLFNPEAVTVGVGDEVTWINSGRREHRVRAEDGSFDSGPLRPGGGWRFTPTAAGSIGYFCPIFPAMRGSLTVTIAAPSTTPDGPPSAGARRPTARATAEPPAGACRRGGKRRAHRGAAWPRGRAASRSRPRSRSSWAGWPRSWLAAACCGRTSRRPGRRRAGGRGMVPALRAVRRGRPGRAGRPRRGGLSRDRFAAGD